MRINSEDSLQAECFKWYNNNFCLKNHNPRGLIMSIPNGGSRNVVEAMKLKSTGVLAGASDLIVITPKGSILFIELKTIVGTQKPPQIDFQERIEALGYKYFLVRSFETFKTIFESYV